MKKTITLNTFRKIARAEEAMMRVMMPTVSAADPLPMETAITPRMEVRRLSNGVRLVKPLNATFAEVARA